MRFAAFRLASSISPLLHSIIRNEIQANSPVDDRFMAQQKNAVVPRAYNPETDGSTNP